MKEVLKGGMYSLEPDTSTRRTEKEESKEEQIDKPAKTEESQANLSKGQYIRLIYSAIAAALLLSSAGNSQAFTSPMLEELLNSANSTHWLGEFENCLLESFIGPFVLIGGTIGAITSSLGVGLLGSAVGLEVGTLLAVLGWVLTGVSRFATTSNMFWGLVLTGRLVIGFSNGWIAPIRVGYASKIAPAKWRFSFIAVGYTAYTIGTIEAYTISTFLPYWICSFIYAGQMIVLLPLMTIVIKPRTADKVSLALKVRDVFSSAWKMPPLRSFCTRQVQILLLFFFHVNMGHIAMLQYIGPVLSVAGAKHWAIPHGILAALAVGVTDFIGSVLAILISSRIGHVLSCAIGAAGTALGHMGIVLYFVLIDGFGPATESDHYKGLVNGTVSEQCFFEPAFNAELGEQYSPLVLVSMSVMMLSFGTFWMIQPYVITAELFSENTRALALGIGTTVSQVFLAVLSQLFPFMEKYLGPAASFTVFLGVAVVTVIVLPVVIPETKGRPMGERGARFTPKQNLTEMYHSVRGLFGCKHIHTGTDEKNTAKHH